MSARIAALALSVAWLSASPLAAQSAPSDQDRAQALAMLQAGNDAATDGDWESARVAFSRAYALVTSTRVLMNLAGAQRHTGHLIDARASYQRWLTDADARDEPYRATVEQALAEIQNEIPQLTVSVSGGRAGDAVEIDGHALVAGEPVEIDPGAHTLELVRGTTVIATERIDLALTDHSMIELAAPSLSPRDLPPEPPPRHAPLVTDHDSGDVTNAAWFWPAVLGGGGALVLGIIIGVAVAASGASTPPADVGTLGPFRL